VKEVYTTVHRYRFKLSPIVLSILLTGLLLNACGIFAPRRPDVWQRLPEARYPIPPYARWLEGLKICLDPGHGGQAYLPGYKRGPTGLREAEVNLRVALYLRDFLEGSGAIVVMTRVDDSFVGLRQRCEIANRAGCDLFISLHHNASSREEANYTSTWYHFTPDYSPASLDLARYLQAGVSNALRLAEYPPTGLYSDQLMYKSGFGVLRNIKMPGALMEASFHSNPAEEDRLRDGEYNRREAYGYFLGLAQYAAAGFPHAELLDPPEGGSTADKTPMLRLQLHDGLAERGIWGRDRLQIFTETVIMRLDGERVNHQLDPQTGLLTYQVPETLNNGWHAVRVELMNAYKNHNLPRALRFQVAPPAAFAAIWPATDTILADGAAYVALEITALDADSLLLADGSRVEIRADRGVLESPTVILVKGSGRAYLHAENFPGAATVTVPADSVSGTATVHFADGDWAILQGQIRDALSGEPIEGALVRLEGHPDQLAVEGYYFYDRLRTAPLMSRFWAPGYYHHSAEVDLRRGRALILDVDLYPVDEGVLFDRTFILDPQFGGSEFGEPITGELVADDLNLAVCEQLRDYLQAAGATVLMLREQDVYVSPKDRVLQINEAETGWYLRIEHHLAEDRPRAVGYTPSADEYAKQLGRSVLAPLSQMLGIENGGLIDTGDYELVQANKNALSIAFQTIGPSGLDLSAGDPVLLEREAYALYRGLAGHLGLEGALREDLTVAVEDSRTGKPINGARALLDGVLELHSYGQGKALFVGLRSRDYRLTVEADGYLPVTLTVPAGTGRPVVLKLTPRP
jgi:N-acetylmuramoyl-L-alanine amidase